MSRQDAKEDVVRIPDRSTILKQKLWTVFRKHFASEKLETGSRNRKVQRQPPTDAPIVDSGHGRGVLLISEHGLLTRDPSFGNERNDRHSYHDKGSYEQHA